MRIAFLGKGGSGKTTTSAGFIRYLSQRKPYVLALDADVNAHLLSTLRFSGEPQELGRAYDDIANYLAGERQDLVQRPMIMTTPPSLKSRFVRVNPQDELLKRYAIHCGNVGLMTVGRYKQSDVGSACYHSKLSGAIAILHHLLDTPDDFVVSDNTAGTDAIATSLWFAFDMNVFVVEPTLKSVQVFKDFISIMPGMAASTFVIVNKVNDDEDSRFIERHIAADRVLGYVPTSVHLRRFEQGDEAALDRFFNVQAHVFDAVLQKASEQKRDWKLYLQRLRATHSRLCRDWYDNFYSAKLDEGLDADFSYEAVLNG